MFWRDGEGQPFGISSVQSLSPVCLSETPWTAACQASPSITNSWSPSKLTSIDSVMPSNHLILCRPLLLLPSIFPIIRSSPIQKGLVINSRLRLRNADDERPKAFYSDKDKEGGLFTLIFIHGCTGAQGEVTQWIVLLKLRAVTRWR